MWDFTEEDRTKIEAIYQQFRPLIPEVPEKKLYDRIYSGYCWGEGGFRLIFIEDWERVFGFRNDLPSESVFDSWEDYDRYKGDWYVKSRLNK